MIIKLPRKCLGNEIIKTFKETSEFHEFKNRKWQGKMFIGEVQCNPNGLMKIWSMGVITAPHYPIKRLLFWGDNVWFEEDNDIVFTLQPIELKKKYGKVRITIKYKKFDYSHNRNEVAAIDPASPLSKKILPPLQKIINNFLNKLKTKKAI